MYLFLLKYILIIIISVIPLLMHKGKVECRLAAILDERRLLTLNPAFLIFKNYSVIFQPLSFLMRK